MIRLPPRSTLVRSAAAADVYKRQNQELAAVLARAEQIAADLTAEANRILAGIDAAAQERARTPLGVSEASLNAAYDNFQRLSLIHISEPTRPY